MRAGKQKNLSPHFVMLVAMGFLLSTAPASAGDPQRGEPVYQRYCSGCHGVDGRGGAKTFMPHIGALTKKGYIELLEDDYLTEIISEGGEKLGKSGFMPSFKTTLSGEQIGDVI